MIDLRSVGYGLDNERKRMSDNHEDYSPIIDYDKKSFVDEAQDISIQQLRFLAALGGGQPNGLFFAGDLGQRIFQQPFSWKALGVDIRGRSRTLRINYRTSHQIRMQADRLLGPELADVDGNTEERSGTVSVFNGPPPDHPGLRQPRRRKSRRSATGCETRRRPE